MRLWSTVCWRLARRPSPQWATAVPSLSQRRPISMTVARRKSAAPIAPEKMHGDIAKAALEPSRPGAEEDEVVLPTIDPAEVEKMAREWMEELEPAGDDFRELMDKVGRLDSKEKRAASKSVWYEDEDDEDMIAPSKIEDDRFEGNDITSMAHGKLEELREYRQYSRVTVWEMPLLAKFAKPFEPPALDMPLRFRYTSYMGEFHPAEKKVVVQFCPSDLGLTPAQQLKLKKLAGPRYNPEKEKVHMSCEMFEHQAQNKRYLGDLVEKLMTQAKDPTDTFEDVPLDTRHHEFKNKPKFPKTWYMTEKRRRELQSIRAEAFLLDQKKGADGTLVDGGERIRHSLPEPTPRQPAADLDPLADLVEARPSRPRRGFFR